MAVPACISDYHHHRSRRLVIETSPNGYSIQYGAVLQISGIYICCCVLHVQCQQVTEISSVTCS